MNDREVIHLPNPRSTRIEFGSHSSGLQVELTRSGLWVFGYHGIECGFIPWHEFEHFRRCAELPLKEARALDAHRAWKEEEADRG